MTKSGLSESIRRGLVLTLMSSLMIIASIGLFSEAPEEQVQLARFAALIPFGFGLLDMLTVTARRDTRNLLVVILSGVKRNVKYTGDRVRRSFGTNESCVLTSGYVESCDKCHRTEHQGIHVKYQRPFRFFGYSIKGDETKEKTYCAICADNPTFEIEEDWGRREEVEEELQRYYDRK